MTLLTPENFKNDWERWAGNQLAHAMIGQFLFGVMMIASLYLFGEFGSRVYVLLAVAVGYATWELLTYDGRLFWDAIEDFCFVVVYGAGWLAAAFHEVLPGDDGFEGNISAILPVIGLFAFHTTLGVFFRLKRRAD